MIQPWVIAALAVMVGYGASVASVGQGVQSIHSENISEQSDEFSDSLGLARWLHIDSGEGWNADQLAMCAFSGEWLAVLCPVCTWYKDNLGAFGFAFRMTRLYSAVQISNCKLQQVAP